MRSARRNGAHGNNRNGMFIFVECNAHCLTVLRAFYIQIVTVLIMFSSRERFSSTTAILRLENWHVFVTFSVAMYSLITKKIYNHMNKASQRTCMHQRSLTGKVVLLTIFNQCKYDTNSYQKSL